MINPSHGHEKDVKGRIREALPKGRQANREEHILE